MEAEDKQRDSPETTIRRTISRPGGKTAGLYIYLGEPSERVVERVAGQLKPFVTDFAGRINTGDFVHNAGSKICECDCFCSCACDCTCNCDCVCYCDCNCPCLCKSACDSYLALEDIRAAMTQIAVIRERMDVRFGDIGEILQSFRQG
jgi:hypothetical protein